MSVEMVWIYADCPNPTCCRQTSHVDIGLSGPVEVDAAIEAFMTNGCRSCKGEIRYSDVTWYPHISGIGIEFF